MKFKSDDFVTLTRLLVIALTASLQACALRPPVQPNAATVQPAPAATRPAAPIVQPAPPAPYDGHVRTVSSWQDHSADTAAFTNAITISVDCDDADAVTKAEAILAADARPVLWFAPMFAYGSEGYELRTNASDCWQREHVLIAAQRARSIAVWLLDEPPDVAWSFWVDNGTRYDPNRYNGILTTAAAMIHADVPDLTVAYNVGSVPAGLAIAAGVDLLGLEAYDATWAAKLAIVEGLTAAPIWLFPPAFVDGDPVANDASMAARFQGEFDAAKADPRITGLYAFLWCCDDTTTGDKSFYTVSGGRLPLTRQAFVDVGTAIVGGAR